VETLVRAALARRWPAIACALALPLCALLVHPYAELGIIDDGPYIKSAQLLAQTGHVVYNGWAAPILGWQLFLAAALIKLFGFSFTVARSAVLLVAMATAFLLQRIFVRAGIGDWNAAIGTLAFVLSPLFLPLALTFMTDVPAVFCIVVCLYACLRASQSRTVPAACAWICFAAASNAVGGTVRQTAWVGALVIVPSALWLLHRRPRPLSSRLLIALLAIWLGAIAAIFAFVHWFYLQPYTVHERLIAGPIGHAEIKNLYQNVVQTALNLPAYLLPVLLMFIPAVRWRNRRAALIAATGTLVCVLTGLVLALRGTLATWLIPMGDWFTIHGAADGLPIHGQRPVLLPLAARLPITAVTLAGAICLIAFCVASRSSPPCHPRTQVATWRELGILLVPFTLAYLALLLPRAIFGTIFDRYLLPLIVVAMLALLRLYQDRVRSKLPQASLLLVVIIAAYSIASTHDTFSMFRARLAALNELRAAGIPPTAIDGGFDTNSWTQIAQSGYLNDFRIVVPAGAFVPPPPATPLAICRPQMAEWLPSVHPLYALSFDPTACAGESRFAPVSYRQWLGASTVTIYIVDVGAGGLAR
jgi:hypothetical protein